MTRHVVCETSFSPTKNSDTSDHMHRDTSDHLLLFHSVKPDFNQRGALPLSKLRDGSMYDGIRAPSVLIQRRICVEQKTGRNETFPKGHGARTKCHNRNGIGNGTPNTSRHCRAMRHSLPAWLQIFPQLMHDAASSLLLPARFCPCSVGVVDVC